MVFRLKDLEEKQSKLNIEKLIWFEDIPNYKVNGKLSVRQNDFPNEQKLKWLINSYKLHKGEKNFFGKYFNKIYGVDNLEEQLNNGYSENEIRKSWEKGIDSFKLIRKKYLIY